MLEINSIALNIDFAHAQNIYYTWSTQSKKLTSLEHTTLKSCKIIGLIVVRLIGIT